MNKSLDELLGSELAGELTAALGLADKGEAESVLRQVKSLETELLMDALHSALSSGTVTEVFHRALIDALAKHVMEKNELEDQIDKLKDRVDSLAGELSEAHENGRYIVNKRDALQFELTNLRYQVEDIAPYRELIVKLVVYITATPGTLNALLPDVSVEVDEYLLGQKIGQKSPKLEAIMAVRKALLCGLKEAKDLVEARMAMHEADRVASLEAAGVAIEKLVPVGSVRPNFVLTKVLDDGSEEIVFQEKVTQAEKDAAFEKMNHVGPTKLCAVCARFMDIDDKGKILSHQNLFTGIECEGTETAVVKRESEGPTLKDLGIEPTPGMRTNEDGHDV